MGVKEREGGGIVGWGRRCLKVVLVRREWQGLRHNLQRFRGQKSSDVCKAIEQTKGKGGD